MSKILVLGAKSRYRYMLKSFIAIILITYSLQGLPVNFDGHEGEDLDTVEIQTYYHNGQLYLLKKYRYQDWKPEVGPIKFPKEKSEATISDYLKDFLKDISITDHDKVFFGVVYGRLSDEQVISQILAERRKKLKVYNAINLEKLGDDLKVLENKTASPSIPIPCTTTENTRLAKLAKKKFLLDQEGFDEYNEYWTRDIPLPKADDPVHLDLLNPDADSPTIFEMRRGNTRITAKILRLQFNGDGTVSVNAPWTQGKTLTYEYRIDVKLSRITLNGNIKGKNSTLSFALQAPDQLNMHYVYKIPLSEDGSIPSLDLSTDFDSKSGVLIPRVSMTKEVDAKKAFFKLLMGLGFKEDKINSLVQKMDQKGLFKSAKLSISGGFYARLEEASDVDDLDQLIKDYFGVSLDLEMYDGGIMLGNSTVDFVIKSGISANTKLSDLLSRSTEDVGDLFALASNVQFSSRTNIKPLGTTIDGTGRITTSDVSASVVVKGNRRYFPLAQTTFTKNCGFTLGVGFGKKFKNGKSYALSAGISTTSGLYAAWLKSHEMACRGNSARIICKAGRHSFAWTNRGECHNTKEGALGYIVRSGKEFEFHFANKTDAARNAISKVSKLLDVYLQSAPNRSVYFSPGTIAILEDEEKLLQFSSYLEDNWPVIEKKMLQPEFDSLVFDFDSFFKNTKDNVYHADQGTLLISNIRRPLKNLKTKNPSQVETSSLKNVTVTLIEDQDKPHLCRNSGARRRTAFTRNIHRLKTAWQKRGLSLILREPLTIKQQQGLIKLLDHFEQTLPPEQFSGRNIVIGGPNTVNSFGDFFKFLSKFHFEQAESSIHLSPALLDNLADNHLGEVFYECRFKSCSEDDLVIPSRRQKCMKQSMGVRRFINTINRHNLTRTGMHKVVFVEDGEFAGIVPSYEGIKGFNSMYNEQYLKQVGNKLYVNVKNIDDFLEPSWFHNPIARLETEIIPKESDPQAGLAVSFFRALSIQKKRSEEATLLMGSDSSTFNRLVPLSSGPTNFEFKIEDAYWQEATKITRDNVPYNRVKITISKSGEVTVELIDRTKPNRVNPYFDLSMPDDQIKLQHESSNIWCMIEILMVKKNLPMIEGGRSCRG
ncbi:MAG: hypothetical protein ISR65_11280 [Bacteriovoracaceae bacterium]|nr:hypothetical protein [Bacteriovoracaceae bacterium]